MHPAYSVIVFTVLSGAGYGLLFLLCLLGAAGVLPADRWLGLTGFAIAFLLVAAGLLSSTAHLGRPERAWRALTQWRSSWLSREGVLSLATLVPCALFAFGRIAWAATGGVWALIGALGAALALATVFSTGMIYATLKTVRQWHSDWVAPVYVVLALATGSLWLNALAMAMGQARPLFAWLAVTGLALGLLAKFGYWRSIDAAPRSLNPGAATGLGRFGTVRQWEGPHTQDNYVLREMGFRVARRHAHRLRRIALLGGFAAPLVLTLFALTLGGPAGAVCAVLALGGAMAGALVERWLFFAEAQHVVTLYYGAAEA